MSRIMLIGDSNSFMVKSIRNGLAKTGYDVVGVEPTVEAVSSVDPKPRIWILYLDDALDGLMDAMVYIRDVVAEEECAFFIVGNGDGLDFIGKFVPVELIDRSFLRPLDMNELLTAVGDAEDVEAWNERRRKILVVDDNATALRRMKSLLSGRYDTYMASSGMNAITFLAQTKVDLILLDYEMPVVDGSQVLEMLKSDPALADIPVMFLTAKSDKESVTRAASLHPEKYLLKSMSPVEILRSIDIFFRERRSKF